MQKIVCTYTEQLTPVAKDMCKHLVDTFAQVSKKKSGISRGRDKI